VDRRSCDPNALNLTQADPVGHTHAWSTLHRQLNRCSTLLAHVRLICSSAETTHMILDQTLTYAGLPAVDVRDQLKQLMRRDTFRARDLNHGAPLTLVTELLNAGLVGPSRWPAETEPEYELTTRGYAFAQAALTGIKRTTADKCLADVVERAKHINADPTSLYRVKEIVVFGSYLDPKRDLLANLNLAVDVRRDNFDLSTLSVLPEYNKVIRRLKNRSRTIAIVELATHRTFLSTRRHEQVFFDTTVSRRH